MRSDIRILLFIFKELFGEDFNKASSEDKVKLQRSVFLLQDLGVGYGYGFAWFSCGVYSLALRNAIEGLKDNEFKPIPLAPDAVITIKELSEVINSTERNDYSVADWVNALSSLHYIRSYLLGSSSTKDEIIEYLERNKPRLNKHEVNQAAYRLICKLFGNEDGDGLELVSK